MASATSATTATNIAGGAVRQLVVQTGTGTTGFVVAPTTASTYLQWNGTAFVFASVAGATGGTVTSVGGTGTVSGITLTGTVTSTGNLTLGGTLSLVSPGAIGGTTASSGRFTTVQTVNAGSATAAAGQIYLNGITSNRIDYNQNGVAAPTFNAISAGAKVVLFPQNGAAAADYAIGIESNTLWTGVPTASQQFVWYAGVTNVMSLSGAGVLTASSFSGAVNGTVGATTPSTAAFTTISASSTVSGIGFSNYFASPPAIGGTAAAAGSFTTLTYRDARDTVFAGGTTTGTITPNAANGNVQTITLTGSITLNALASPVTGQSLTLIVRQPATGGPFTLTSSMLFAGGFKTLSTANNAIDMITISYIGTTYYASLVTGFA